YGRQPPDVLVTRIEIDISLSIGGDAIDLTVGRRSRVERSVTPDRESCYVELSSVVQQRTGAGARYFVDLSVVSGAKKHIALVVDYTGPDVSLLCVENFVE